MGLSDGTRVQVMCPEAVKACNEHMGGVDLADLMCRFYTCTHKLSRNCYFQLFWFLVDLAVDIAYVLECWFCNRTPGQVRYKNKLFRKELATEPLSKYSSHKFQGPSTR